MLADVALRAGVKPEFAPVGIAVGSRPDVSCQDFVAYRGAPPKMRRTLLPVRLFCVQEEPLVEAANRNECFAAKEKYRSNCEFAATSQGAETERLDPRAEGCREWPCHAVLGARAVLPLCGRYTGEPRIFCEACPQSIDRCGVDR
jgi:hypothetical protein